MRYLLFSSLVCCLFCPRAIAADLMPRAPLPDHPVLLPSLSDTPFAHFQLTVKFKDEFRVRAQSDGDLLSEEGGDLSVANALIDSHGVTYSQLISLPDSVIVSLEERAAFLSKTAQPDIRGLMKIEILDQEPGQLLNVAEALQDLELVEYVYIEAVGAPPPGDLGTPTPDYTANQTYVGSDPGIDMSYMNSLGITGSNIRLSDCEYGWNQDHEDLMDKNLNMEAGQSIPQWVFDYGYDDHGTAVVGITSAADNGYGLTGLVSDAEVYTYPEYTNEEGSRRATSIYNAIVNSASGDVVLLEMQTQASYITGDYLYGPAELSPNVWMVSKMGTDAGVILVSAGGNGNQNLDSSAYALYTSYGDSGAIIVGAGSANANHNKLGFSSYGSRVNVQGWGEGVFTTGYGDYAQIDGEKNQEYTSGFSGTSSASPIVASACVAIQDYAVHHGNDPLTPAHLRQLLMDTGIPQGSGANIGPFPDLASAIDTLDTDLDGSLDPDYGGRDCDDDDTSIYPDATDVWYDGIDSNCDGANDYDADGDGYESDAHNGLDCDDQDASVYPGAVDIWYDGIDGNCDGLSDYDADGDGYDAKTHNGSDCNDSDAGINPDATEVWYDGLDTDCDGGNDFDADGDGYVAAAHGGGDCDDENAAISPGAQEVWYDNIDSDCDGGDDFDADGDGHVALEHGGTDCDDGNASVNPDGIDEWYDGIDSDCDGLNDFDADGDGFEAAVNGGPDCNDSDSEIHPDVEDIWYDGVDSNCDGANDFDADGDGSNSNEHGGDDCDDTDAAVNPNAEEVEDGIDNDCDGNDETWDEDGDGLTNLEEAALGSNPKVADTDGDGISDAEEVANGTDPSVSDIESGKGQGCSSTGSPGHMAWPMAFALLLLGRRRRDG